MESKEVQNVLLVEAMKKAQLHKLGGSSVNGYNDGGPYGDGYGDEGYGDQSYGEGPVG